MSRLRRLGFAAAIFITGQPLLAADTEGVLAAWFAAQKNLQSWSADFVQTRTLKGAPLFWLGATIERSFIPINQSKKGALCLAPIFIPHSQPLPSPEKKTLGRVPPRPFPTLTKAPRLGKALQVFPKTRLLS